MSDFNRWEYWARSQIENGEVQSVELLSSSVEVMCHRYARESLDCYGSQQFLFKIVVFLFMPFLGLLMLLLSSIVGFETPEGVGFMVAGSITIIYGVVGLLLDIMFDSWAAKAVEKWMFPEKVRK